jgi:hypothetical protein
VQFGVNRGHTIPAWVAKAYHEYTKQRQTLRDLQERYHKDPKTLRKYFDQHHPHTGEIIVPVYPAPLAMDTTYFGSVGVLVCRSEGKNVYWKATRSERVIDYLDCVVALQAAGMQCSGFVIDGKRGVREALLRAFPGIPVQYCQFHQLQIITQRLTRRPKLAASTELKAIAHTLTKTTRDTFEKRLQQWYERWHMFLKERTDYPKTKRQWRYTHERLRSAYFSLKRNTPWLFTYLEYPDSHLSNTTNTCDGSFGHWKSKVKIHRKLAQHRRKKMIDTLLG